MDVLREVQEKVDHTRARIAEAARRAGRAPDEITLVGVSKYATPNDGMVEAMLAAGLRDLAENRPQRFLEKAEYWGGAPDGRFEPRAPLAPDSPLRDKTDLELRWHFIGSLQRNKVRKILPYVALIHSVDSWKLLEAIDRILEEENELAKRSASGNDSNVRFPESVPVLLEVHISEDETKQGFAPGDVFEILPRALALKRVEIRGLMGMAGLTANEVETRRQFASLRRTLEECRRRFPNATELKELSMGMSGDFEIAVEEGATIVRIGSSLYPEELV